MMANHKIIPYLNQFLIIGTINKMFGWQSKELSDASIATPAMSDNSFAPNFTYSHNSKMAVKFV